MSFILRESSIGHFAKSASRASTILSWKVDIRKVLDMFACTSEDFLRGVPKSPVHNVIIDFAHGGDIVRSNCRDRSNPKYYTAFILRIHTKPKSVGLAYKADSPPITSNSIVTQEHFTHRNKVCSSTWHMEHLGEFYYLLIPSIVV